MDLESSLTEGKITQYSFKLKIYLFPHLCASIVPQMRPIFHKFPNTSRNISSIFTSAGCARSVRGTQGLRSIYILKAHVFSLYKTTRVN